jgi:hypothetical protein
LGADKKTPGTSLPYLFVDLQVAPVVSSSRGRQSFGLVARF